jgi:hypothetical protein
VTSRISLLVQYLADTLSDVQLANALQYCYGQFNAGPRRENTVKKMTFVILAFIAAFGSPRAIAQEPVSQTPVVDNSVDAFSDQQVAMVRKDIRSMKKQLIATNLTLTENESITFWPVYEQYSAKFGKINDTRAVVIKEYAEGYGTLTD